VIGRDLCSFSWLDQKGESDRGARRREAELEGLRISIAQDSGFYIVLFRDSAAVWTWDNAAVANALQGAERDIDEQVVRVPEPLMLTPEIADGLKLTACLSGFEGQSWRNGELVGSRWWREKPTDHEWLMFAESVGLSTNAERAPDYITRTPLARPWKLNEYRPQNANVIDRRTTFWIGAAVTAVVLGGLTYVGGVELTHMQLAGRVARLETETAPVREAHRRVMSANAEYRRITAPITGMDGLEIVTAVATIAARSNIRATALELRNDRIYISFPRTDTTALDSVLRLLDEDERFANARLSENAATPEEYQVEAEVVR